MPRSSKPARSARGPVDDLRPARRRRKRFIPSLVLRYAMMTVLVAGTSAICWNAVSQISHPYVLDAQQEREISQKTQTLEQMNTEIQQMQRSVAYLNRPDGIENEARLKGYLKTGEVSLVITSPSDAGNSPKQLKQ